MTHQVIREPEIVKFRDDASVIINRKPVQAAFMAGKLERTIIETRTRISETQTLVNKGFDLRITLWLGGIEVIESPKYAFILTIAHNGRVFRGECVVLDETVMRSDGWVISCWEIACAYEPNTDMFDG